MLPCPRASRLTSRARERELETLRVKRTVEGGSCDIAAVYTAILMSNGNAKIVICSFVREEDNVVLPRPRDSRLTSRARERELETLGVERTVEGGSCDIAAVYVFNKIILTIFPHL
ncbi:hypothetical protein NDU88_001281 [Pleurodeles waltl]|uniref:Uncharacterized protein n=1 Tax=Pleurodeles waltl TaxID=8319 RepID=A0AAV7NBY7_PLEWA|nr:hypothetical protein NDU88_001281 [Pleurodeles waltl]